MKPARRSFLLDCLCGSATVALPKLAHGCTCVTGPGRTSFDEFIERAPLVALVKVMDVRPPDPKTSHDDDPVNMAMLMVLRAARGTWPGDTLRILGGLSPACQGGISTSAVGTQGILISYPAEAPSKGKLALRLNICADDWLTVVDGWVRPPRYDTRVPLMKLDAFFARYAKKT